MWVYFFWLTVEQHGHGHKSASPHGLFHQPAMSEMRRRPEEYDILRQTSFFLGNSPVNRQIREDPQNSDVLLKGGGFH
jgi:hypothetical protein